MHPGTCSQRLPLWPLPAGEKSTLLTYNVDSAAGVNYTIDLRRCPWAIASSI